MSNRPRNHLATAGRRYPFIPGVLPEHTPEWTDIAMREAHELMPHIPGTTVHVLILDRDEGLVLIADHFGQDAATMIAALMRKSGPSSVPTLCCRVPFTWTTDRIVREAR